MNAGITSTAALTLACLITAIAVRAEPARMPADESGTVAPPAVKKAPSRREEESILKQLRKTLDQHIQTIVRQNDGFYIIGDPETEDDRMLTLKRVDTAPARRVSDDKYILRADFTEEGDPEFGEVSVPVEVDFSLVREKGNWTVEDETLYSVSGVPRFSYSADNQRVFTGEKDEMGVLPEPFEEPTYEPEMENDEPPFEEAAPDLIEDEQEPQDESEL
ncbi:MAG: hypothetical protein ABII00_06850 [Elusimicrobiota bacterium]